MKIKEVDQTAHIAWSPAVQHPIYLAAGTAAQQLDASFSTTAKLELYSLDLNVPGLGMGLKASIPTKQRFHKLVWGSHGISDGSLPSGVLVGGADQGHMMMFNAAKLLDGDTSESGDYLISETKKHTGPVKSLDFNPTQMNLLASGATDSEIYIWDLNSPGTPMTPGSLSLPPDDVTCLAWNRQVQHILASTFASRCVVWDLRKNEPIIKVSDSTSRMRCKSVAWHPETAIQLCLASEDDRMPVIQLWDLRFATSPLKTFEGHQSGILSMAWCSQDSDLLLSCGKDNRVLIWNANTQQPNGEILSELTTSNQWCFDAGWCPRNPSVIAAASFDGRIGVHSIMGGRELSLQPTSNMIADSFPGMESTPTGMEQMQQTVIVHQQLRKPPSWLRPVCGASFGFGGKLVSFGVEKNSTEKPQVHISQVITEENLVVRSQELETALQAGNLGNLCDSKATASSDQETQAIWNFLGANFNSSPRQQMLNLLGYELPQNDLTKAVGQLDVNDTAQSDAFDTIAAEATLLHIPTDNSVDGRISKALLTGDLATAVDICFSDQRYADALVLAMAGPADLLETTRKRYFNVTQGDVSRLIQAVVTRNWLQIVQHCDVSNWKEALAATLTYADDSEFATLCQTIGQRLESEKDASDKAVLCYICAGDMEKLVNCWLKKNDESTGALQELVEQVMVLRQAQQHLGRGSVSVNSGSLTEQLCRYAGLLAGQGNLQTALTYLDLSQDASMVELKERLQRALGHAAPSVQPQPSGGFVNGMQSHTPGLPHLRRQPLHQHQQQQPPQQYPHMITPSPKPTPPANPYYNDPYNPAQSMPTYNPPARPSTPHQNWGSPSIHNPVGPPAHVQPPPPAVGPPAPSSMAPPPPAQQQSYGQPPMPSAAPVAPPPAPPSGGSMSARSGISLAQRSRVYVQDPSLFGGSAPRTVQSAYQDNSSAQFQPAPMTFNPQFPSGSSNQQPFQPAMYQPSGAQQQQPYGSSAMFQPAQFTAPVAAPLVNGSSSAVNNSAPAIFNPVEQTATANAGFMQTQPLADLQAPLPSRTPPVVPVSNPPPGWNDPPQLSMITKTSKIEPVAEPITHPIFGTAADQQYQHQQQQQQHQQQQFYGNAPQMMGFDGSNNAQYSGGVGAPAEPAAEVMAPVNPAPVAAPIPSEHQVIHDVFYLLKDRCNSLANNAQMKRKLEDVSKKLESLDDRLRNNGLSANTLNGLHQIVQSTQAGDYNTSMTLHTQLVSTTNFTEIGSFMPGLKVLIQLSAQLGVQAQ